MLDVGDGGSDRANDRGREGPASGRQEGEPGQAADRLEPPRCHVLVRHRVAEGVGEEPERERAAP